jgi:hypothetical protein
VGKDARDFRAGGSPTFEVPCVELIVILLVVLSGGGFFWSRRR